MNINDLSYINVTEETTVTGGWRYYYRRPRNTASASAGARAIGYNTYTSTYTNAQVFQGGGSQSHSGSYASTY